MRIGENPAVEIWMQTTYQKKQLLVLTLVCFNGYCTRWEQAFVKKQEKLVQTSTNLIDQIWEDRPAAEVEPVIVQPLEFAGLTVAEKFQDLREKLTHERARGVIISVLDEVLPHMKENKIEVQNYDAVGSDVSLLAFNQLGFTLLSNTTEGKPGKDVKSGLLESAPTVEASYLKSQRGCKARKH